MGSHMKPAVLIALILALAAVGIALKIGYDFLRRYTRVPPVPSGTIVHRNLPYVTGGHARQKLDLYLPKGAENPPLMILVHGGSFTEGDKRDEDVAEWLTQGYAVASLNYRLVQDAIFPAQIEDMKAAARWLRASASRYGYDPDRFGARGSSAGGYLVTMLGATGATTKFDIGENLGVSSRVQAVADRYAPIDFLQMDAHQIPGGVLVNTPDSPIAKLIDGIPVDNRDKAESANPINYITKDCPPFIIIHGDSDPLVPHHQSEILAAALERAGVPVTLYTVRGGGHGGFDDPGAAAAVRDFFARYLKPGQSER